LTHNPSPPTPPQPPPPAVSRQNSQLHFGLPQLCGLACNSNRTCQRQFASAAQRKPVDSANRRLPHRLEQVKYALSKKRKLFSIHRRLLRQFANVRARHKRFFSSASQNQYTHVSIISSICQRITQLFHRLPVQRIQHLRPVKCDPRNRIALLVNQIPKRHRFSSLIFSVFLCALCASFLCAPPLEFPRNRLRGIILIIKPPSPLPSFPPRQYHSFQQRRRRKS